LNRGTILQKIAPEARNKAIKDGANNDKMFHHVRGDLVAPACSWLQGPETE
jgi:hypothetical protein